MGKSFGTLVGAAVVALWLGYPIYEDYTWHKKTIFELEESGFTYELRRGGAVFAPWTLMASPVVQINFFGVKSIADVRIGTKGYVRHEIMGETEPGGIWSIWANCTERAYKEANITGLDNYEASDKFAEAKINIIGKGELPNEIEAYSQAKAFNKACED